MHQLGGHSLSALLEYQQRKEDKVKVWVLITQDPMIMRDDDVPNAVATPDGYVVTVHEDFDAVLHHIRKTYDPDGYYADEGSGSLQNYLHGEGYEFHYYELETR